MKEICTCLFLERLVEAACNFKYFCDVQKKNGLPCLDNPDKDCRDTLIYKQSAEWVFPLEVAFQNGEVMSCPVFMLTRAISSVISSSESPFEMKHKIIQALDHVAVWGVGDGEDEIFNALLDRIKSYGSIGFVSNRVQP